MLILSYFITEGNRSFNSDHFLVDYTLGLLDFQVALLNIFFDYSKTKKPRNTDFIKVSGLLYSSERGIRTLDTTGMNRVL